MKALKSARTLAASLGVLAVGAMAATPAMAFDRVDWSWTKEVKEKIEINAKINLDIRTSGLVEIEKLQIFLGDVNAQSYVSWVDVNHYGYAYFSELGEVVSKATAIGNLQVITSDVPVYLHDGQFLANTRYDRCDGYCWDGLGYNTGNLHTDLAFGFLYASVAGYLSPAYIHAYSHVDYVTNATVDSNATAIGNLISVDLQSNANGTCGTCSGISNHVLIADITQFAYANVSAYSGVDDVTIDGGYTGGFTKPLVNSVATAIGNAVIINVSDIKPSP